jgi:hypothetical protein
MTTNPPKASVRRFSFGLPTDRDIVLEHGPNSAFGKFLRERGADRLYRESKKLPPNAPIDPLSEDYSRFWDEYVQSPEARKMEKEFYKK